MICSRCLQRATKRTTPSLLTRTQPTLAFTTTQRSFAQTARSQDAAAAPAADANADADAPSTDKPAATKGASGVSKSSVPAGTVLKGLNFMKNKTDPVALEDSEYPAWLWTVLEKKGEESKSGVDEGDLFAKSKKLRQRAAKAMRKEAARNPGGLVPKVPVYEQTIDLPAGDGSVEGAKEAELARRDLTKSMRENRRSGIKEANFLKGMR